MGHQHLNKRITTKKQFSIIFFPIQLKRVFLSICILKKLQLIENMDLFA